MKRYFSLLAVAPLIFVACDDEYGTGIGRAQHSVDTTQNIVCQHYLSQVRPHPDNNSGGKIVLAFADNSAKTVDNYFLCSFGQCHKLASASQDITVDLPLAEFSLSGNGEIALVAAEAYNKPENICSYLAWDSNSDTGDSSTEQNDGTSDTNDSASEFDDTASIEPKGAASGNSMSAAVVSGHWQAGQKFPYNNQGCTMTAKVKNPVKVQDWECK